MNKARAVVYEGPENFTLHSFPLPEVGPDDMLVEVLLCGVDGSELHMYRGEFTWLNDIAPVIFGDEILARVARIGDRARTVRGLAEGDRVIVESRWPCDGCRTCDRGQYYLCERRGGAHVGYGTMPSSEAPHLWGGYATHTFVPAGVLAYPVPERLPDATAVIAGSPLANGLRWVEKGNVEPGSHVTVIGPGTQGLACTVAAVRAGATVTVVGLETDRDRLDTALALGAKAAVTTRPGEPVADTAQRVHAVAGPVDTVIETAGAGSAKALALEAVRPMGTLVNVSVPTPAVQPIDWMGLLQKEVVLVSPMSHPHTVARALDLAVELLDEGVDLGAWITHTYPLEEAGTAIAAASYQLDERPVKVVLDPAL